MSKKIAEGIQGLVLDIKTGNGAFMNTMEKAISLGNMLKAVGEAFGVKTDVIYSSMHQPLGRTAGMWCEIAESIVALKGNGPKDLMDVVYKLGAKLLIQAGVTRGETAAISIQENLIQSGNAYQKFEEMVHAQSGHLPDNDSIHTPSCERMVTASESGYITEINTLNIGWATIELGCGRHQKSDQLDPTAGIEFFAKIGDTVAPGDPIFRCFNSDENKMNSALNYLTNTVSIGSEKTSHRLFFNS